MSRELSGHDPRRRGIAVLIGDLGVTRRFSLFTTSCERNGHASESDRLAGPG